MVEDLTKDEPELTELRTKIANQAASLSKLVAKEFGELRIGAGEYAVELPAPEVPSTGGGAQARQNIRLVPRDGDLGQVMAGIVDPVTLTADLRTFDHVAMLHENRYKRPLLITAEEYASFLTKLDTCLKAAHVRSTFVAPPPGLREKRNKRGSGGGPWMIVAAVVVVAGAAAWWMRTR